MHANANPSEGKPVMQILVVEDDTRAADQLAADLRELNHDPVITLDGRTALAAATERKFDAILLDVMLPNVDGVAVARLLRDRNINIPIVMLSALGDLEQRIAGLDAGADDYLVKPAAPTEIDARLQAIIRRTSRADPSGVVRTGDIEINEVRHRVTRAGRTVVLPNIEFRVLCQLAKNMDGVVTRQMLYQNVWNYDFEPATKIIDTVIRRLRGFLNAPDEEDPIVTVRGIGYMLKSL
jgi:two-component system OmpR family response regulator